MNKTWASGAIELLKHAVGHINLNTAFDKRIAFISTDNAVEIMVKIYLSLPKQFFGDERPSKKEIDDCNNSFTNYLSLLVKCADKKLIGFDPGDIEHYHRIRNTLYHDGTGLSVDQEYLNAYFVLAKLLLKRLFNVDFQEHHEKVSLEKLIVNWNHIEEYLTEISERRLVDKDTDKWAEEFSEGLITMNLIEDINNLRQLRNKMVHSKSIDNLELREALQKSKLVLQELKKQVENNREAIKDRNFFYEPSISDIKGKLTLNKFYGPPTFGATPDIDMIEQVWILNLDKTINVHQHDHNPEEGINSTQYNIDRIQLAPGKHNIDFKKYQNKIITVKGMFWGEHTGHHFTPVLMSVIDVLA